MGFLTLHFSGKSRHPFPPRTFREALGLLAPQDPSHPPSLWGLVWGSSCLLRQRVNLTSWFVCERILLEKILIDRKRWTTSENLIVKVYNSFPGSAVGKEPACQAGDVGLILRLGVSSGEGNWNPLQCSCLGNTMDKGAWRATVHRAAKSRTRLSVGALRFIKLPTVDFLPQCEGDWVYLATGKYEWTWLTLFYITELVSSYLLGTVYVLSPAARYAFSKKVIQKEFSVVHG